MTLPQGWAEARLGDIADFVMGQAPPGNACNFDGNGTPFVKAGEFGPRRPVIREWTTQPLKMARAEDVLICVVGATSGKLNLGADCAIGRSVAAIRPSEATSAAFVYPRLQSEVAGLRASSTGTAQGVISKEMLADIEILLPPVAEQRRIVAKLDALTARLARARAELNRVPALAAKLRRACLDNAFSDENMETWEVLDLEQVVANGLIGLVRSKAEQGTSGAPYLRMGHYDLDGRLNEDDLTSIECSPAELRRFQLRPGDVLFNTRNSVELVGKVALWPQGRPGWVYNNNILRLRFRSDILPDFAFRYMMSPRFRNLMAEKTSATTSVAAIYQRSLYAAPFPVPSLNCQREIVSHIGTTFARADHLEAEAARARALLDRLESAILARAFGGELVPQDPDDEPASVLLERIGAQRAGKTKTKRGRKSAASDATEIVL